jgi:predicted HTH transcriptional regulator
MTKTELLNRLSDIEWEDFEVKEAHTELPKNIWETVSAFSNASGGWIILGVENAENAGFGYDKMITWKYKVEFDTYIDYSEAAFYLGKNTVNNAISQKTVEKTDFTPQLQNWKENSWVLLDRIQKETEKNTPVTWEYQKM